MRDLGWCMQQSVASDPMVVDKTLALKMTGTEILSVTALFEQSTKTFWSADINHAPGCFSLFRAEAKMPRIPVPRSPRVPGSGV